ncbi:hypothetical protein ANCCEY_08452 [Ancylostoma ceylanicum]|uniref:Uncharacterized protein n=1 Tax=Ancylostoma ceylanicum TaxID=53326 RepID=A0A0D6LKG6_9BILA|nr:hypothetical protein ANCCEY_08452 [Ancylostoma ceylanicum]
MDELSYFNRTYMSHLNALYRTCGFIQPQIIVYITDNFEHVVDFPRFYLYPHEWNRMRFTARYIELIENKDVCTQKIFGKDAECVIRKWLLSNVVYPFNCTLSYLTNVGHLPPTTGVCKPEIIADNYYNNIQLVWNSADVDEEYEYVREVYTTSVPGFMSQIGGLLE